MAGTSWESLEKSWERAFVFINQLGPVVGATVQVRRFTVMTASVNNLPRATDDLIDPSAELCRRESVGLGFLCQSPLWRHVCTFPIHVSRFILFPNLAYNWTFNCSISSRIVPNFPSTAKTDSSIFPVDDESISCTSGNGKEMNVSPIL